VGHTYDGKTFKREILAQHLADAGLVLNKEHAATHPH
jgi:hypothetical protein